MSTNKRKVKKKFFIESLVIFFIALTPILLKVYDYLPGPNHPDAHQALSFLGIEIGSNGFDSISTNVWFYSNKIIPLMLCIFWFFTSKNWWYHIIIIPIATFAFQLFELFFSEDKIIDSQNIFWLLPVCMVVIPFVYFIRVKLVDKYVHGIDLEAMEAELRLLKQKQSDSIINKEANKEKESAPKKVSREYRSLSEKIEYGLSTHNIEMKFKQFQNSLKSLLHL